VLLDHLAEGVDDPGSPLNMVGRDVLRNKFRKLLPEESLKNSLQQWNDLNVSAMPQS
jgi:hypothetical protein